MSGTLDIKLTPLDEGDDIGLDTFVNVEHILGGEPGDLVAVAVPAGKGLIFEAWLRRQLFGGEES